MEMRFPALLFTFLFFADQIAKVAATLFPDTSDYLNLSCNNGVAWGLSVRPEFFYAIWIAILFFLIRMLLREKNRWNKLALVFILSGGISNMFDRVQYGCVIDFIDLKYWPAFNLADIYITVGVIVLLIKILRTPLGKTSCQNP